MDRSLKWRTVRALVRSAVVRVSARANVPGPSVVTVVVSVQKTISLGLDLQGGMHLVYSIDLGKPSTIRPPTSSAISTRGSPTRSSLRRFKTPAADPTTGTPLGAVTVILPDGTTDAKKAETQGQILSDYNHPDTVIEIRDCPKADGPTAICFRVATSYADGIKKAALTNAVATIRERINGQGVAEPTVVEKGDQIEVELPGNPNDPKMIETKDLITHTAKLDFKVVDDGSEYMNRIYKHLDALPTDQEDRPREPQAIALDIKAKVDQWPSQEGGANHTDFYLEAYDRKENVPGRVGRQARLRDARRAGRQWQGRMQSHRPPGDGSLSVRRTSCSASRA